MKYLLFFSFLLTLIRTESVESNALIDEESPYLQQHAHNPVDWYPWGKEAFEKAYKENKLIFLSIGYSACHWCHVMEQESFRNKEVAALLNRGYVSIKVDKEQFPQIDKRYQRLYSQQSGHSGGWPLSVFMTPDKKVFFITTYIPKEEGYGSKGLLRLLPYYRELYTRNPKEIEKLMKEYEGSIGSASSKKGKVVVDRHFIDGIVAQLVSEYDPLYGGFSKQPKFPEASKISLLLEIYRVDGDKKALEMAKETLLKMARGGLYDQVDGGFFRYTTDRRWHIPHFEKMLYTNAELIPQYLSLYHIDRKAFYLRVVHKTIAEMDRHFMKDGLYFASSDADSEGEEGAYYLFLYEKIEDGLKRRGWSKSDIRKTLVYLGIEEDGNIDGEYSHLHLGNDKVPVRIEEAIRYLEEIRGERNFPFVDKKVITSWNAMMIKALFAAGSIDKHYIDEGKRRLEKLLGLISRDDRLYHQALFGSKPSQPGILEDYAFVTAALIEAHQHTLEHRYLELAKRFAKKAIKLFYRSGEWYLSADGMDVVADADDRHYTSPLSTMLAGLQSLTVLMEDEGFDKVVRQTLKDFSTTLENSFVSSPALMSLFLRRKIGDVVIRSSAKNLFEKRKEIASINYPFTLIEAAESNSYLACRQGSCFAESNNFEVLAERIEKEKKHSIEERRYRWK